MKVAIVSAPGKIQILEVPKPQLSPEHIIIKVQTASICNATDTKLFTAEDPTTLWPFKKHPFILGHECFGKVVEVGSDVEGFEIGNEVVLWTIPGEGFAEYISVPVNEVAIGKVDGKISPSTAPIMEMVIGCSGYLFDSDGTTIVERGANAVVYGLGPAGLIFIQVARALGAGKIVAVGRRKLRLDTASHLGANIVLDEKKIKGAREIKKYIDTPDVLVDTTGSDIVEEILSLSRPGMFLVPFGIPPFNWEDKLEALRNKGIIFHNSGLDQAKVAVKYCIDWVTKGLVRLEPLVTHRIPLEKVEEGLDLCRFHKDNTLKVILDISSR